MALVTVAELRAGGEVEGVFACTRKDRLTARNGTPYLAVELRDRTRRDSRAARSATRTSSRASSSAATWCRWPAASSASATSSRWTCAPSRRPRPTPPSSCRWPTATSRSSTASSSTSPARSTTRTYARLLDAFLDDEGFRAELRRAPCTRAGHHAYLGGLLEHTVAVATLAQESCAPPSAPQLRPAALRGDPPRHRQDARVRARRRDPAQRGRRADGPRGARPAAGGRARAHARRLPGREAERDLSLHPRPPRRRSPSRDVVSALWRRLRSSG